MANRFRILQSRCRIPGPANGTCEDSPIGNFAAVRVLATVPFCTGCINVPYWIRLDAGLYPSIEPTGTVRHKTLEIKFEVYDVVDAIRVVNQNHVSADEDVTIAAGRRRQTAIVVGRNRVNPSTHVSIEHVTLAQPGFVFRSQSIAVSEAYGWMVAMFVVPITRDLLIVVIEP
jgi:hypothetical protein